MDEAEACGARENLEKYNFLFSSFPIALFWRDPGQRPSVVVFLVLCVLSLFLRSDPAFDLWLPADPRC